MKPLKVAIVSLGSERAELLGRALKRLNPQNLVITQFSPDSLGNLDYNQIHDTQIVAIANTALESRSVLSGAQRLRSQDFYWEAVHLCVDHKPATLEYEEQWAIYFHSLPPVARRLIQDLKAKKVLSRTRRKEIVQATLTLLTDELSSLVNALDPLRPVEPERVRACITNVITELSLRQGEEFNSLRLAMLKLLESAAIAPSELNLIERMVISTENTLREAGNHGRLLSTIHTLNNVIRLATYQPERGSEISARLLRRLKVLGERGLESLPLAARDEVLELKSIVSPILQSIVAGKSDEQFGQVITQASSRLFTRGLTQGALPRPNSADNLSRIVVVEDDPDWLRLTVNVIHNVLGTKAIDVQEATTLAQAQTFLKDDRPALVLVDLGLPSEIGLDILPDAGLVLIKQFLGSDKQGRRYGHRFVVLTAAENYAEAVREAVGLGISPSNYLQKDPHTWESDLRAQLRLALEFQPVRLPAIEVFRRTGRLARVEGLEIKLDYPQWCLLAVLAESRKGIWNEPEKLSHVLYWNYSLNPESRNPENSDLDPKERVLRQLPYYVSDLRQRLAEAYMHARHHSFPGEILSFQEEVGYRLNAQARVLGRVDEHFRLGRRPCVLILEDNLEWSQAISEELTRRGFDIRTAYWTERARELLASEVPDLISLDLELPASEKDWQDRNVDASHAIEFLDYLHRRVGNVPVTILTGIPWRDKVMLEVLRKGVRVNDYLSKNWEKPIDRLTSSLARLWQETLTDTQILDWDPYTPFHPIVIDAEEKLLVRVSGYSVKASGKGNDILRVLSSTPNVFVSRAELIEAIYGSSDEDEWPEDLDKGLNQHIKRLRKVISDSTHNTIAGDEIICGDRGIYWLRGIVQ